MSQILEAVFLHYTDGRTSDKVYNIYLEELGPNQFNVTGFNGKRGGTLTPRKQNDVPVTYIKARQLFDDLEQKKRNDRKTPYDVVGRNEKENSSTQATVNLQSFSPEAAYESTGYIANHPKKVTEQEAAKLFNNDDYFAEQKCDGNFVAIKYLHGQVTASNKLGNGIPVPAHLATAIRQLATVSGCEISLGLAGEYLDSTLHVFTVWEKNGTSLLTLPQRLRIALREKLEIVFNDLALQTQPADAALKFIYTAKGHKAKLALYEKIKASNGEGIVFKNSDSDHSFKYKLYETTEVLLVANSKRSAACFAYHEGTLISLGSTTLPNDDIHKQIKDANLLQTPIIGSVKYLYLSSPPSTEPGCGQLIQSSFLRFRPEFDKTSCTTKELKIVNKTVHNSAAASSIVQSAQTLKPIPSTVIPLTPTNPDSQKPLITPKVFGSKPLTLFQL